MNTLHQLTNSQPSLLSLLSLELFELVVVLLVDGVLGLELGDGAFHEAYHVGDVDGTREGLEFVGNGAGLGIVVLADLGDTDAAVACGYRIFRGGEDLFVEFLTGTEAGILNLDVFVGNEAGELNHATSHVGNLDALTHIEDEDLVTIGHDCCLHDETAGLGDGHEEASDIGMGDGEGASLGYLLAEARDDGAVGAEDVSKSCSHELSSNDAIRKLRIEN